MRTKRILSERSTSNRTRSYILALACLLGLALSGGVAANASSVAVVDDLDTPFDLNPFLYYLEDPEHNMTFDDIQAGQYDHRWRRNTDPVFIGKDSSVRYWFRLQLRYPNDLTALKPVLHLLGQEGVIAELTLWLPENNGQYRVVRTGHLRPYGQRDIPTHQYAFYMPTAAASHTVFGVVDQLSLPVVLPFSLYTYEQFHDINFLHQGVMIAFYAIMAALMLYNACLFVSLRLRLYGYYLLLMSAALYVCAYADGSTHHWLWPNMPGMNFRVFGIMCLLALLCYLAFLWEALSGLSFSPRLRKGFKVAFWLGGLAVLYSGLTPLLYHIGLVSQLATAPSTVLALIAILSAIRHKLPTAGYLLVAEVAVITGTSLLLLMVQGIVPVTHITIWFMHGGFAAEALLLSLFLAARTSQAQLDSIQYLSKYESLYQQSQEGLFEYNLQTDEVHCNPAFAHFFAVESAADFSTGKNRLRDFLQASDQQILMQRLRKEGQVASYETQIHRPHTNEITWVSLSLRMNFDKEHEPLGVEGSSQDITERKLKEAAEREREAAEREREAAEREREAAETESQTKSQYLAIMSHEIRTPMSGIVGIAELLDRTGLNQQQQGYRDQLFQASKSLLNMLNDLLDFSKIDANKMVLEHLPVNLDELVAEVSDLFALRGLPNHTWVFAHRAPACPAHIVADPVRLRQVVNNLMSNAVKFTQEGQVVLTVTMEDAAEGRQLRFVVEDSGIGINEEAQSKLFQDYQQATPATGREHGGTGLGLAICKRLVELWGGTVGVSSKAGTGSRFWFTLPLQVTEASEDIATIDTRLLADKTLCLVDHHHNTEFIVAHLRHQGATLQQLDSSDSGFQQTLAAFQGDLVVIDSPSSELLARIVDRCLAGVIILVLVSERSADLLAANDENLIMPRPHVSSLWPQCCATALAQTKQSEPIPIRGAKHILLADDNPFNRSVIAEILKQMGHQVEIATNGEEALAAMSNSTHPIPLDLVLMDKEMPVMDGLEAIRRYRESEKERASETESVNHLPIILYTAHTDDKVESASARAGADIVALKPSGVQELDQLIRRIT